MLELLMDQLGLERWGTRPGTILTNGPACFCSDTSLRLTVFILINVPKYEADVERQKQELDQRNAGISRYRAPESVLVADGGASETRFVIRESVLAGIIFVHNGQQVL